MASHEWVDRAPCRTNLYPDAWFPESTSEMPGSSAPRSVDEPDAVKARRICKLSCPVKAECHEAGLLERHGIWAGVLHSEEKSKTAAAEAGPPDMVPSLGTTRRLQALAAIGWTSREVANDIRRYVGIVVNPLRLDRVRLGEEDRVPVDIAEAVQRSVKHLSNRLGNGALANNLMEEASGNGWLTPRQWKGFDYDDPDSYPGLD